MEAKTLMLTHFSQRYPKLPVIPRDGHGKQMMKVALAFDMMKVKVGDIGRFEKFIPALRELYKDEADEEEPVEEPIPERIPKKQEKKNKRQKTEETKANKSSLRGGSKPWSSREGAKQTVAELATASPV